MLVKTLCSLHLQYMTAGKRRWRKPYVSMIRDGLPLTQSGHQLVPLSGSLSPLKYTNTWPRCCCSRATRTNSSYPCTEISSQPMMESRASWGRAEVCKDEKGKARTTPPPPIEDGGRLGQKLSKEFSGLRLRALRISPAANWPLSPPVVLELFHGVLESAGCQGS